MCSRKETHSAATKHHKSSTSALIHIDFKHSVIYLGKRPRYKKNNKYPQQRVGIIYV